jgi:protein gp37
VGVDPGRRSPRSAADSSSWNAAARSSDSGAGNSNTNRLDREDNCYALTLAKRLKAMGNPKYQVDGDPRTT